MLLSYLLRLLDHSIVWVDRETRSKDWILKISLMATLLSLFSAFPSYDVFLSGEFDKHWGWALAKIEEPFRQHSVDPLSYFTSWSFRLTVPVLAHVLNFGVRGCLFLQLLALFFLFYGAVKLAEKVTGDRVCAAFLGLGLALTFCGNALVSDLRGRFDIVAYCLMVWAMAASYSWQTFVCIFLAGFTDERALIASPLIYLWFVLRVGDFSRFDWRSLLPTDGRTWAIPFAWGTYFLARLALIRFQGFKPVFVGNFFVEQLNNLPFGIWTGLEGLWLMVAGALAIAATRRRWLFLSVYGAAMAIVVYVAGSVQDITRSMAYLFPALFVGLEVVKRYEARDTLRRLVVISAVICLFPTYYASDKGGLTCFFPFPLQLVRIIMRLRGH